jgi:hypothetical protein
VQLRDHVPRNTGGPAILSDVRRQTIPLDFRIGKSPSIIQLKRGITVKTFSSAILLLCSVTVVGCASPYVSPTSGPVAYMKLIDETPNSFRGIYEAGECKSAKSVETSDWFPVPANRDIGFVKVHSIGNFCIVRGEMVLREGQRVALRHSLHFEGITAVCVAKATEQAADGSSVGQVQILPPKNPACRS